MVLININMLYFHIYDFGPLLNIYQLISEHTNLTENQNHRYENIAY